MNEILESLRCHPSLSLLSIGYYFCSFLFFDLLFLKNDEKLQKATIFAWLVQRNWQNYWTVMNPLMNCISVWNSFTFWVNILIIKLLLFMNSLKLIIKLGMKESNTFRILWKITKSWPLYTCVLYFLFFAFFFIFFFDFFHSFQKLPIILVKKELMKLQRCWKKISLLWNWGSVLIFNSFCLFPLELKKTNLEFEINLKLIKKQQQLMQNK